MEGLHEKEFGLFQDVGRGPQLIANKEMGDSDLQLSGTGFSQNLNELRSRFSSQNPPDLKPG